MKSNIKRLTIILVLFTILMSSFNCLSASDWIMYQNNPRHTGYMIQDTSFSTQTWTTNIGSQVHAAPILYNDKIIISTMNGSVKAFDAQDGSESWDYDIQAAIESTPAIYGDDIFIASDDGYLYSNNIHDESNNWKFKTGSSIKSSPAVDENNVYVGSDDGIIYAIDIDDGNETWQFKTNDSVKSSPVVVDDVLYVGSDDDKLYAIDVNDGSELWSFTAGDNIRSSPAVYDDKIYIGSDDNQVYALNKDDGSEDWTFNAESKVSSAIVIDHRQSTLYVATQKGKLFALDMRDGLKKWDRTLAKEITTTPTLFGNNIAVGTSSGQVIMLNKFTGNEVWSYNPGYVGEIAGPVSSSLISSGGSLFFVSEDGNVYSLNTDQKVGPTSVYTYYIVAGIVALIAVAAASKILYNRRKK
jgi:outer membrane protein assembly factor BamB